VTLTGKCRFVANIHWLVLADCEGRMTAAGFWFEYSEFAVFPESSMRDLEIPFGYRTSSGGRIQVFGPMKN
jgi:hypothetical protein